MLFFWWLFVGEAFDIATDGLRIAFYVFVALAVLIYLGYDPLSIIESWLIDFARDAIIPF
ncbi:hypothetical protein [Halalkalirubrum salinum]|uniref:hypothetical protein n=1 Tax=Halalkalirubrum salinum TaxID=2563889 RepID=UPI0010FAF627|nr:hypothetical protein [Halalkalirubrum salinum]